jgi:hypothetical protein
MARPVLRFILSVILTAFLLIANWNTTAVLSSVAINDKAVRVISAVEPYGIRLLTPNFEFECRSQ